MKDNYFVKKANEALEAGEDLTTVAYALEEMAQKAMQGGFTGIWNQICEAQMILGI